MKPVLEFSNVSRSYKAGLPVLDRINLSMEPGEVLGLIGRNGAGKTTLIRLAMGMLYPEGGEVRLFGLSPTTDPIAVKKRVGYVAEDQVLPSGSTIAELIEFHRYLFPQWDADLERSLLDRFSLPKGSKIGKLSKGQAREVALLCAICHRPELLILDEPAGGLDPAARRDFLEASIQLLNREGTAILFSSHHMGDIERIGGRVVLLDDAAILLDRQVAELRENIFVAVVSTAATTIRELSKLPGCLRARTMFDNLHAVIVGSETDVRTRIMAATGLGPNEFQCLPVPLEELFIELVGGGRS